MCTFKFIKMPLVASLLLIVTACGGGEDGGDSAVVLNGQVADGYLSGAIVVLDRNGNRMPDPGEPSTELGLKVIFRWTSSREKGIFSRSSPKLSPAKRLMKTNPTNMLPKVIS